MTATRNMPKAWMMPWTNSMKMAKFPVHLFCLHTYQKHVIL